MNTNFSIKIQLTDSTGGALELDNISIDAVFYMHTRERYRFHAGVTDARGRLVLTFEQFERVRLENQALFIMDYNILLQDCDPEVGLTVPTSIELQQRKAAKQMWFSSKVMEFEQINECNNGKVVCEPVRVDMSRKAEVEVFLVCGNKAKKGLE